MRIAWNKGLRGFKHSEETKKKIGVTMKKKELWKVLLSPEVKRKAIIAQKKSVTGNTWSRGRVSSEQTKEKIRFANIGKKQSKETVEKRVSKLRGANHWKWIDDRTQLKRFNSQGERRTSAYFFWRKSVLTRDFFKCKLNNKDCNGRIEAHHILGWNEHPELRYDVNNGITLCHFHHPRKRMDEKLSINYFKEIVKTNFLERRTN